MGDLAFSYTILGHYYKSENTNIKLTKEHFDIAKRFVRQGIQSRSTIPACCCELIGILFLYIGYSRKAKSKADEVIKMGYRFSPAFMKDLEENFK